MESYRMDIEEFCIPMESIMKAQLPMVESEMEMEDIITQMEISTMANL